MTELEKVGDTTRLRVRRLTTPSDDGGAGGCGCGGGVGCAAWSELEQRSASRGTSCRNTGHTQRDMTS